MNMVLDTMTMDLTNRLLRRHPDHKVSDNSESLEIDSSNSSILWEGSVTEGRTAALPPARRISRPHFAARGCVQATMPSTLWTTLRREENSNMLDRGCQLIGKGETAMEHSQDFEVANYGDVSNYVHAGHVEDEQPSSIFYPTEI